MFGGYKLNKIFQRIVSAMTAVLTALTFVPYQAAFTAEAASEKTITGVRLNELKLPGGRLNCWRGDFIYFGNYNGIPLKFRLYSKSLAETYGISEPVLTLDCDNIIENISMFKDDEQMKTVKARYIWQDSPAKAWLESEFYSSAFNDDERALIAKSSRDGGYSANPKDHYEVYNIPIKNSYFFPLDCRLIMPAYGHQKISTDDQKALFKTYLGKTANEEYNKQIRYWISSSFSKQRTDLNSGSTNIKLLWAKKPKNDPDFDIVIASTDFNESNSVGISPVMNIKSNDILFTSKVDEYDEFKRKAYTLTLKADDMLVTPEGDPTRNANTVTLNYTESERGKHRIDRVSVVVTDRDYREEGAKILHYEEIKNNSFILPDEVGRMDPSSYCAYIFGEERNGEKQTDFASEPQEIKIPKPANTDSVSLSINEPIPGKPLGTAACTSDNVSAISVIWRNHYWNMNEAETDNADYGVEYSASITVTPQKGSSFSKDTKITGITPDSVTLNANGTLTVTVRFPATRRAKILEIKPIADKTFTHGTTNEEIKKNLPAYILISAENASERRRDVTWDTSSLNSDPSNADSEQVFIINGVFDAGEYDCSETGNEVSIKVIVSPHTPSSTWLYNDTKHYKLCNAPNCGMQILSEPHDLVDGYDNKKYKENGGSIFDYPIKRCSVCRYQVNDDAEINRIASVTTADSTEPQVYSDFVIAWSYARANPGSTITLLDNVEIGTRLNESMSIDASHNITIDLNGFYLKMPNGANGYKQFTINGGSITVNDSRGGGKIIAYCGRIFTINLGSLIINGGTLTDEKGLNNIYNEHSSAACSVVINGGTIDNGLYLKGGSLTINGGTFHGKVSVYGDTNAVLSGGTFDQIEISSASKYSDYRQLLNEHCIYRYTSGDNAGTAVDFDGQLIYQLKDVEVVTKPNHKHDLRLVRKVDAACTTNGVKEHLECSCGKVFSYSVINGEMKDIVPTTYEALTIPASHSGGTADCTSRAVCTVCGKSYGELADIHSFDGTAYGSDAGRHWILCTKCGFADTGSYEIHDMQPVTDCTKGDECSVCGYHGESAHGEHNWSAWSPDPSHDSQHIRSCTNSGCTVSETGSCTGGTADCVSRAKCPFCKGEYGSTDPDNHAGSKTKWSQTEETHVLVYECCGVKAGVEGYHSWNSNNVCNDCGYGCTHSLTEPEYSWNSDNSSCTAYRMCEKCNYYETEKGTVTMTVKQQQTCTDPELSDCTAKFKSNIFVTQTQNDVQTKEALGHQFSSEWEITEAEHYHRCVRCDETSDKASHSGGTADCLSGAVCGECQKVYGAADPDNHVGTLGYVSVSETAHRQKYSCCGAFYGGEEAHDKLGENGMCSICGFSCYHSYSIVYTWNDDNMVCTASAVCSKCSKTETEMKPADRSITQQQSCTSPEITTYSVDFTNALFTRQTKDIQTKGALGHSITSSDLSKNSSGHWNTCSNCTDKVGFAAHSFGSGKVTKEATETSEGTILYVCMICGYEKTEPISPIMHEHIIGESYSSDETGHWKTCESCDEKVDFASHISDSGAIAKEPTALEDGEKVFSCTVCGYVIKTETIPASGGNDDPTKPDDPVQPTEPVQPSYQPSYISLDEFLFITRVSFTDKLKAEYSADGSTLTISWDKIGDAEKYIVYQQKDGKYKPIKYTKDTSLTLENLKNDTTYKFIVKYIKDGSISPISCSSKLTVKMHYKPSVTAKADRTSVTLTWRSVPNAEKYAVYKYENGKVKKLAETEKTAVMLTGLAPETEYRYIVSAFIDGKWTSMTMADIVSAKTK